MICGSCDPRGVVVAHDGTTPSGRIEVIVRRRTPRRRGKDVATRGCPGRPTRTMPPLGRSSAGWSRPPDRAQTWLSLGVAATHGMLVRDAPAREEPRAQATGSDAEDPQDEHPEAGPWPVRQRSLRLGFVAVGDADPSRSVSHATPTPAHARNPLTTPSWSAAAPRRKGDGPASPPPRPAPWSGWWGIADVPGVLFTAGATSGGRRSGRGAAWPASGGARPPTGPGSRARRARRRCPRTRWR